MTNKETKERFPELYEDPEHFPPSEQEAVKDRNKKARKLYRAIRHLLVENFSFTQKIPPEPKSFPGDLDDQEKVFFLAVHGIMLADTYPDPSIGKDRPSDGDTFIDKPGDQLVIDRRFADAVVAAVQEYTSRSGLFGKVFGFLQIKSRSGAINPRAAAGAPV